MITIECFKGLPIEHEPFLIEKYNSFITTCRYIEIYHSSVFDLNYMLFKENDKLIEIMIYGNNGAVSRCFNSLVDIDQSKIDVFTKKLFEIHPNVKKIKIVSNYKEYNSPKTILYSKSDDHILILPTTMDDYFMKLGSSTRQHIKNRKVRLLRDYNKVNFVMKYGADIEKNTVEKIIQMNIERMKHKGKIPKLDDTHKNFIYKYSQHYGCVAYIEVDGLIIAGSINTVLNKELFGHITAHDNNFSKYNVGELCAFYLIQTSIEKGLTTFHFLWGASDLKRRLLAKPHLLFSYFIYRSYSFDYFVFKANELFLHIYISFKNSRISIPIRNLIVFHRKKKWKDFFMFSKKILIKN